MIYDDIYDCSNVKSILGRPLPKTCNRWGRSKTIVALGVSGSGKSTSEAWPQVSVFHRHLALSTDSNSRVSQSIGPTWIGNHGNDQPLRAKEACLQICGGPPKFPLPPAIFCRGFWSSWQLAHLKLRQNWHVQRAEGDCQVTYYCTLLSSECWSYWDSSGRKRRWWKSKVKQHSLTLLFIDSISSSLYRVFNPRWKTVITRPDGDSWLQPDWSTVWYYLTFSCCSLHTLHIFTHSLFSLQGDFFMDPSLRRPMQVYIWAESPKTLQTVFFFALSVSLSPI